MVKSIKKYNPGKMECPVVDTELPECEFKAFTVREDKRDLYELFVRVALAHDGGLSVQSYRAQAFRIARAAAEAGFADVTIDNRTDYDKACEAKMRNVKKKNA